MPDAATPLLPGHTRQGVTIGSSRAAGCWPPFETSRNATLGPSAWRDRLTPGTGVGRPGDRRVSPAGTGCTGRPPGRYGGSGLDTAIDSASTRVEVQRSGYLPAVSVTGTEPPLTRTREPLGVPGPGRLGCHRSNEIDHLKAVEPVLVGNVLERVLGPVATTRGPPAHDSTNLVIREVIEGPRSRSSILRPRVRELHALTLRGAQPLNLSMWQAA
jgi:hypothetical protein